MSDIADEEPRAKHPDEVLDDELRLIARVASAFDDLPIVARIEFAKNLVFDRDGDKHSLPADGPQSAVSILAVEILDGVIEVLKAHPAAAKLNDPSP